MGDRVAHWLRTHRRDINRRARSCQAIGGGLVIAAGLVFSALAVAAGSGHRVGSTWLYAAGIVGGVGLLLGGGGWLTERATHRELVSEAHAETLRRSAEELLTTAGAGEVAAYGFGYKTREAFHAHYKATAASLDESDAALTAGARARSALHKRLGNEAHTVEWSENEGRWKNADWSGRIYTWLLGGAHDGKWTSISEMISPHERPSVVMREDGESDEDYEARAGRNIARMRALALAAREWPETKAVAETHARVVAFERDQQLTVIEALIHIREQGRIPEAKGCPVCEDEPQ
jgi:hypothetical protein